MTPPASIGPVAQAAAQRSSNASAFARQQRTVPDSTLLQLVDDLQEALESAGGGLLLLIDELGKFLEHEARHGGAGIFLLQQLAEHAFRGRKANLLLIVLLHQGFDLYEPCPMRSEPEARG